MGTFPGYFCLLEDVKNSVDQNVNVLKRMALFVKSVNVKYFFEYKSYLKLLYF